MITKAQLKLLRPYLLGEQPRADGEWDMYCPLHHDTNRSAQINVDKGVWFCQAGCGGGRVSELIQREPAWLAPPAERTNGNGAPKAAGQPAETITEAKVAGWVSALWSHEKALAYVRERRGISSKVARRFELGWDADAKAITMPVRGEDGTIWNVRRYAPWQREGRRKIWSVEGMGSPARLYPLSVLTVDDPDEVVVAEGEWDALRSLSEGFPAVTRTSSATTWLAEWGVYFKGRTVYLAHDADNAGATANRKVGRALRRVAEAVKVVPLPYEQTPKDGKDLSDYFDEYGADQFSGLLRAATPIDDLGPAEELNPADSTALDALDSRKVGKPLALTVTVRGKRAPGYSVPAKVHLSCSQDAGDRCAKCPMRAADGDDDMEIKPSDPAVLSFIEATKDQLRESVREAYGAVKCPKFEIDVRSHQSVEVLYVRPSVDHVNGDATDYTSLKLTSVGRHDTQPNNTVSVVGALHPDPRKQLNEFLTWEVEPLETSIDRFDLDRNTVKMLKRFQPRPGEAPLKKLGRIARQLEEHVTHIYGRPEMHAAMDLVFHSALAFDFGGKRVRRGWLELLVVGDTRTGKSEAATQLAHHYRAGEVVSCESASFAGIVGGLQQFGGNKEWAVNWGVVPLNDRRLVVLDEVSGLTTEQIAQLSDVRSRGVAQLTKISGNEATHARTRLIWCGNPRNGTMGDYTYGVQAIKHLIGNAEDLARFDIAMSVAAGDVPSRRINRVHRGGRLRYSSEACAALVRWVWSRTPEQIIFTSDAEAACLRAAVELGRRYIEEPPLIQAANVREKVARLAVALAGRLFSTDESHEKLIVRSEHIAGAIAFLDHLYGMRSFGYAELSRERIADADEAEERRGEMKAYLMDNLSLAKFLRTQSKFRSRDLEEILNCSRDEANGIINYLWKSRMVRKDKADVRVEPALHALLRSVG